MEKGKKYTKEELEKFSTSSITQERVIAARHKVALDKLVHDSYWTVRAEVAKHGYGLDILVNDRSARVRAEVAKQGYRLKDLASDENEAVRWAVVKGGFKLNSLANDENDYIRRIVARQGYGLEQLVSDPNASIRLEVARHGYGLDKLISDKDWRIREEVAKQGYGLEELQNDTNPYVSLTARKEFFRKELQGSYLYVPEFAQEWAGCDKFKIKDFLYNYLLVLERPDETSGKEFVESEFLLGCFATLYKNKKLPIAFDDCFSNDDRLLKKNKKMIQISQLGYNAANDPDYRKFALRYSKNEDMDYNICNKILESVV